MTTASKVALDTLRRDCTLAQCVGVAGYSVGQWSALYAAGVVDAEQLFTIVHARAKIMDQYIASEKSGMLAVIGVRESDLQAIGERTRSKGEILEVANINAPANYSMSGTIGGLDYAEAEIAPLRPKAMVRLPVSGGWHSSLLDAAVEPFRSYLSKIRFAPATIPIVENTAGTWMSSNAHEAVDALSLHLAKPVLWRQGMETLLSAGTQVFVEVGVGDMLSKFGVFISRKARYVPLLPAQGNVV